MRLVDLTTALVNYLRDNVPNPHASGNWIYSDYPRMDVTFPRISVTQVSGSLSELGIGEYAEKMVISGSTFTHGKLASIDYDIDVWVKVNDRATFNGTVYTGTKLRDYLAERVITELEKGKQSLKDTYGIIDIEEMSVITIPLDEANMLHRKTITVRITFIWETT